MQCSHCRKRVQAITVTLMVLGGVFWQGAWAQPRNPPPEREKDPRRMIESMRFWRLTEELRLTDEQAVKVLPKVRALDESRRAYRRQRQGLMRGIDELLRSGSAGDRELRDSMYALDQADEQFRSQTRRIRRELNAMLTVEQQARLLVFEDHFEDEVRDLLSEFRQRNRGPRGSGEGATPP